MSKLLPKLVPARITRHLPCGCPEVEKSMFVGREVHTVQPGFLLTRDVVCKCGYIVPKDTPMLGIVFPGGTELYVVAELLDIDEVGVLGGNYVEAKG